MVVISKKHLVELGYGNSYATDIIRKAKQILISRGHTYYESRKLNIVPTDVVEEILGIDLSDFNSK